MGELYRTHLEEYSKKYKDSFMMRRENHILEVRFHTNGGPVEWGIEMHRDIIAAFFDIDNDPENEVVIVTGTGDSFIAGVSVESFKKHGFPKFGEFQAYDIFTLDSGREPFGILNLHMPVISAINGPSIVHAELVLMNDIVLCSENTYFTEIHWQGMGFVPGDGVHTLWREILGPVRGNYFLYTGEKIDAKEALRLGVVSEVLPEDKLLDRAWELADTLFMQKNRVARRLTHQLLAQPWREKFTKELPYGLACESFGGYNYCPPM